MCEKLPNKDGAHHQCEKWEQAEVTRVTKDTEVMKPMEQQHVSGTQKAFVADLTKVHGPY
jgi:hypothetical protein